jgi:hypothetical protein
MRAAWLVAVLAALTLGLASPAAEAFGAGREEEYGRLVQSVNLGLSDQIFDMPHPSLIEQDPSAAQAALSEWVGAASAALQGQLRRRDELLDAPRSRNRERRAAMRAQAEAMDRFTTAFGLMVRQVEYYAALDLQRLSDQRAWYADAFYDARLLALRVQQDLAFAQAQLTDDPLAAATLRVLGHSSDIQLELSRAAHNHGHNVFLNSRDMAGRLGQASHRMREAIAEARSTLATYRGEEAIAWQDCLDHEALIASAAERLSIDLRSDGDRGFSGRGEAIARVLALYRDRPQRTVSFAMTFSL